MKTGGESVNSLAGSGAVGKSHAVAIEASATKPRYRGSFFISGGGFDLDPWRGGDEAFGASLTDEISCEDEFGLGLTGAEVGTAGRSGVFVDVDDHGSGSSVRLRHGDCDADKLICVGAVVAVLGAPG